MLISIVVERVESDRKALIGDHQPSEDKKISATRSQVSDVKDSLAQAMEGMYTISHGNSQYVRRYSHHIINV